MRRPSRWLSGLLSAALVAASLALVGTVAAVPAPASAAPVSECSIASNGSFEEPNIQGDPANPQPGDAYINGYNQFRTSNATISGWQVVAGTIDLLRYYNNASDGAQSIDMWGTAPATIQQTFTGLVPGAQYSFSVDYSGLSKTQSIATVQLSQGGAFTTLATLSPVADGVLTNPTGGTPTTPFETVTWSTYSNTFTATGTSATVRLQNTAAPAVNNTGLFVDNFTFASDGPCQDFGDAPDSYGTSLAANGARHIVTGYDATNHTAPVMLGSAIDTEADGQPTASANGDDVAGIDDEDGVAAPITITQGQPSSVTVSATNNSAVDVTLAGWIDLNGDGQFQTAERATVTVPANSGTSDYVLSFPAGTLTADSYARFRVYGAVEADPQPIGNVTGGEVEDYPVIVQIPGLSVVKSASPSDAASYTLGRVITYTFVVTNTGNVPLTGVVVNDSGFTGTGTLGPITCPPGADTLAAGAQVSCTATYTLTQADVDAGKLTNSATSTGTPPGSPDITTPPSQIQIPVNPAPSIDLAKSATPATANRADDTIAYSFRVTNTGNVTLSDPTISETAFSGTGTAPAVTCPTGSMLPGQVLTCTAGYTLTQADVDAGTVVNTATASATPPTGAAPVSAPSTAAVSIPAAAGLTVAKTAAVTGAGVAGDVVTYSFLITNTGNVTIADAGVTEGAFTGTGTLGPVTCPAGAASMAPGDAVTCTAAYTLTQADVDAGSISNTATATGTPPGGGVPPVSPPSTSTTPLTRTADLTVAKTATPTTITTAGALIDYSFLVTNTGTVTLTDPVVNETAFSGTGPVPTVVCPPGTTLAPAATVTCDASYTVTQADVDAGTISNTATATATPPTGVTVPVSDPSSASVAATAAPALTMVKSSDVSTITHAGQKVTYTFLVTNTGNVTLSGVAIDEGAFSGTGTLPAAVCPQPNLAPGSNETCTAVYTVTQADVDAGTLTNTATATATPPGSSTVVVSPPSPHTVTVDQNPGLSVVKSAAPAAPADFHAGEVITYSFVVTNTGNVTMSGVAIAEGAFTGSGTLPAPTCPAGAASLAPGAQVICTTDYTVTQADVDAGTIANTATATATPPGSESPVPSDPSSVTVPEPARPAATVLKTADTQKITQAGQVIHYSFTVTNTGNTSLSDPKINEGAFTGHSTVTTPVCPADPAGLLPGQIIVCTATYTVVPADLTGEALANTATVTVTPPGGDPITSDQSTARISDVAAPVKPADPLASTGSTIAWGIGAAALALLIAGGALLLIRRRRATD
ncbi:MULTISPECIES: GEVED domain-containing protein [unclassified Leifsonia]|uniref:DUF7507 domain-containing protein n=1 Tax=unclassified Leifsonia TaxID=2663824 RepID=UPI001113D825|nr:MULTISPECIES: GEVED domain-containing protein [unclassified Leifsonia]